MKAAFLSEYEHDLEVGSAADPRIEDPNQVIVRVGAAGVCRTDVHLWQGEFAEAFEENDLGLPHICGHENAGWIEEVGSGVTHLKVGDAVLLHPLATCGVCAACRAGDDTHCEDSFFPGLFAAGGFAEHMVTTARSCVPIPEGLDPIDVAPLACGGSTAYRAVKKALPQAVPGSVSVLIGAGGLGHIGIQALRAQSATRIVVVDRSQGALDHAKEWGADDVVVALPDHSHVEQIMELTGGKGANVVIDFVGEGGAQQDAVDLLAVHGTDFLVGYGGTLEVDILNRALFPEASYVGCQLATYTEMVELLELTRSGRVKLSKSVFPLDDVNDAISALREGTAIGRGVLVPNEK